MNLKLYLIVPDANKVERAIAAGVTMIQLRAKDLPDDELLPLAREVKEICARHNVPFILNDNVKIAAMVDADGVHLGQEDMSPDEARKILGKDKIIGVTAKTPEQARRAQLQGADYLGIGALFPSATKGNAKPLTASEITAVATSVTIPAVAIGGINSGNIEALKGVPVAGVAVSSCILNAPDLEKEVKALCIKF